MANISHFTQTVNGVSTTYDIHDANAIPRSGGAVIEGYIFSHTNANSELWLYSGTDWGNGGYIEMYGGNSSYNNGSRKGFVTLGTTTNGAGHFLKIEPNGTFTWDGQAIQYVSDQRLKQQITEIDDKLLDAWQDVELCQFKYNDAVDSKGSKARLHTGFVVQQIDDACKSHGVDISEYGLYCHEEYPQETEEVEIEQADGTKTKEKKVIREASEHYSLRYTEALIVECAYLRKKNKELQEQLDKVIARLDKLEGIQTK